MENTYWIYLIGAYKQPHDKLEAVKIGMAQYPLKRLDELQIGNHAELRLIGKWRAASQLAAYDLETHMHKVFRKLRIRGEWFRPHVKRFSGFLNTRLLETLPEESMQAIAEQLDRDLLLSEEFQIRMMN